MTTQISQAWPSLVWVDGTGSKFIYEQRPRLSNTTYFLSPGGAFFHFFLRIPSHFPMLGQGSEQIWIFSKIHGFSSFCFFFCKNFLHACDDQNRKVTELCTGGELFDRILEKTESDEGRYSERDAMTLVTKILSAIAYCHDEHNICHRFVSRRGGGVLLLLVYVGGGCCCCCVIFFCHGWRVPLTFPRFLRYDVLVLFSPLSRNGVFPRISSRICMLFLFSSPLSRFSMLWCCWLYIVSNGSDHLARGAIRPRVRSPAWQAPACIPPCISPLAFGPLP